MFFGVYLSLHIYKKDKRNKKIRTQKCFQHRDELSMKGKLRGVGGQSKRMWKSGGERGSIWAGGVADVCTPSAATTTLPAASS